MVSYRTIRVEPTLTLGSGRVGATYFCLLTGVGSVNWAGHAITVVHWRGHSTRVRLTIAGVFDGLKFLWSTPIDTSTAGYIDFFADVSKVVNLNILSPKSI